jgi:predicted ATPase/serine phosphatase RsbU (regulator of sigma subunit)/tRNA A-37 threonylcarbamoyl transferase component Bud32
MQFLNGYQILSELYNSPNSLVYRALRQTDNLSVIIKLLKREYPTPDELCRYQQEYEMLHGINCSGTIVAYQVEKYENTLALILEDFGGVSLAILRESHSFSLPEFLKIAIQISDNLGQLHAYNIIHKDINPSNIAYNSQTGQVKLIDLGISSRLSRETPRLKNPNLLEGTLAYISPEQTGRMNRFVDYRSDFYSLGATFYELLTGQKPFETEDPLDLVYCHLAQQPLPPHHLNPEIPQPVSDIVMKLLAKNAEDRYQSAWGLKCDLEYCLNQLETAGIIPTFTLGEYDISERFHIPQKLYGREQQVQTLLAAFERTSQGSSELILVAGYSGIGKSALVNEIHKLIARQRGYFIAGKFDQFKRNIPYSALLQAFQDWVRQILTESEGELLIWKQEILEALGSNAQVILDVIPELQLLLGPQPTVSALPPTEAQNRFNLAFQNFIGSVATKEHPLVLFVDDLQWADSASLKLIEILMSARDHQYLLLIGAYRDNEVNASHLTIQTIQRIQQQGSVVDTIFLNNLQLIEVIQLIRDTLNCSVEKAQPLAELLEQKTGGNPFFLTQMLESLYQDEFLSYDRTTGSWQWDIQQIRTVAISNNVVDLMVSQIQKLSQNAQTALTLSACIGNAFTLQVLSVVCEKSIFETASDLWEALQAGLILPLSEDYIIPMLVSQELSEQTETLPPPQLNQISYKFLHDRVQQAAYALIPNERKAEIHFKIGCLLRQTTTSEDLEEKIFEIVNQLNIGTHLITKQAEKDDLADLNLKAGAKAKAATAYEVALQYLNQALNLLGSDSWIRNYPLTYSVYVEAIETSYLNAQFEISNSLSIAALEQAKTFVEKAKIYEIKIQAQLLQVQMQSAIDMALQFLEQEMGISIPSEDRTLESLAREIEADLTERNQQIEDLVDLPEMTDPSMLAVLRILLGVKTAMYITNPPLYFSASYTLVKLCMQYGNSNLSPGVYIDYAVCLSGLLGEYNGGYKFGQVSLFLLEKFNTPQSKPHIFNVFYGNIALWKSSLTNTLNPLKEAFNVGLETGALVYTSYAGINYSIHKLFTGFLLTKIEKEYRNYYEYFKQLKNQYAVSYMGGHYQLILNLMMEGLPETVLLTGQVFDEEKELPILIETNNATTLFVVYLPKSILFYISKKYRIGLQNAEIAEQYVPSSAGLLVTAQHNFYYSLNLLAFCIATISHGASQQDEINLCLEKIRSNQAQMQQWAENCPENYQNKYDLVEAEKASLLGNILEAMDLYDRAIEGAKEQGFIHEEAIAYERASEFYSRLGRKEIAQTYNIKAHYAYTLWGARAKVQALESEYPYLLSRRNAQSSGRSTLSTSSTSGSSSGETLDIATVLKASQAISSEIQLNKLLAQLLTLAIENAGAQKGVLILSDNNQLKIEAAKLPNGEVQILESLPLETGNFVPPAIINYVARTQENVILANATEEGIFTSEPYILQQQTQSLLCAAIVNQGKLIGILYLENNLATGAFTQERIELLQVISAQAAISLENAQLYRTLEDKVIERTAQLAEANEEISALNELLKSDNLRMSAELDVTRQLQQKMLPNPEELQAIPGLEIAGFMEPADEIGGDYYDVLNHEGHIKIGIGDVTGHGLEAGMVMVMVQTAVRTLLVNDEKDYVKFLNTINRMIHDNVQRMRTDKNLTLALLDYADGVLRITGQHEEVLVVRGTGEIERLDTVDLGFPVGLEMDISDFITQAEVELNAGDGVVLYTDGIPEAENMAGEFYGMDRLCAVVSQHWQESAEAIREGVIQDVREFIGEQKVFDDITLVVMKQR